MKNLFEMLQAIFGKNIISKTIGTRTNVIKLPTNKSSPLKNEFDVFKSAENPAVFEKLKKVIEDEAPYISRMNDAERLIYEGNVKRLHDYLVSIGEIKPAITAEVIGLTTKEPIAGKGLASLVEEAGQTSPPGTLIGDIQSRINKLKSLAKEKGMSAEEILQDFASGQKGMSRLNDEGLVRSTAREILINDIKAGKIKNITVSEAINMGEPLDPFRRIYGEGALEQLDSLIPDFRNLRTEMEAEKFARSKFKFEPDENRLSGSVSIEEGRKAEQEYGIKLTPKEMEKILKEGEEEGSKGLDYLTGQEPPEKKADGGRVGMFVGGIPSMIRDMLFKVVSKPSEPPLVTTPIIRPEDEILMRYREYMNASKPSQSDLENKYREFIKSTPATGLPVSIPTPVIGGLSFTSPEGEKITFGSIAGFTKPNGESYTGPVPENIQNSARMIAADGGRIGFSVGGGKKILDLIAEMNKKLKDKKSMEKLDPRTGEVTTPKEPVTTADKIKRKPTKEEYEEYAEILDDSENTVVQGNETFEQLDALVKKQKDYEDYMYMQYKRGKLDPEPGEKTQDRLNFLRKKSEEAGMIGDRRLFTFKEMKELEDLERAFSPMGVAKNKINEAEMIKQKYGNVIDDNLLQQILIDDNPQRKAEVMATIDEALKMQQKGIGPEQIMDIIKNTTRTKQAKGGSVGLGYLAGE